MKVALTDEEKRILLKKYCLTMSKEEAYAKLKLVSAELRQNHLREDNRIHAKDFKENFQELLADRQV